MKKLILAITASLCIATLISSCNNLGISAPKMDSDEATQLIVETLEKNINFDEWKIYEIRWMEADELENNLTVLFVEMVNKAGDCFSQTFTLSGPGKGNISDLDEAGGLSGKLDFEKVKGLTPASINVEAIRKQYEEAKAMIPENYTFKSIGDYLIQETVPSGNEFLDRNKTFGEVKAEFSMNITENGKEIVESAGKKSVQYYESHLQCAARRIGSDGRVRRPAATHCERREFRLPSFFILEAYSHRSESPAKITEQIAGTGNGFSKTIHRASFRIFHPTKCK